MHACQFTWKAIITKERKRLFDKLRQIDIIAQTDHNWKAVKPQCTLPPKDSPIPFPEFLPACGIFWLVFLSFMPPSSAQRAVYSSFFPGTFEITSPSK